jgi:membrane-associated phospholipid phosphatase
MMGYLRAIPDLKAVQIQDVLWHTRTHEIFIPWGGISAMPSMHVSIATLTALAFSNINKWFSFTMILLALIIQVGSVHLGCHYAIDGYISVLATLAIWFTTERLLQFFGLSKTPLSPE